MLRRCVRQHTWAHAAAACKPKGWQPGTVGQATMWHEGQGKAGVEGGRHAQRAQRAQAGMQCHAAAGRCRGGQLAVQAELRVLCLPQHHQRDCLQVKIAGNNVISLQKKAELDS